MTTEKVLWLRDGLPGLWQPYSPAACLCASRATPRTPCPTPGGWQPAPRHPSVSCSDTPGRVCASLLCAGPGNFTAQKYRFSSTGVSSVPPISILRNLCLQEGCLCPFSEVRVPFCPQPASQGLLPRSPLRSLLFSISSWEQSCGLRHQKPLLSQIQFLTPCRRRRSDLPVPVMLLLRVSFLQKDPVKMQMLPKRGNTLTYYHLLSR